ncbi:muramoyltetrapeptide carboxypeptidase [Sporolactobacillus inulinus]|uniref:Muramoyltetrapeptide carboxypeptidase n=1 Tax=Sporolactobacillus inulinus TaxID=2078 RepID=A0A4Y1ZCU7_9BACL|nr:S66 peptidase family protein [Sporolactobacillus inulinus]GAY76936.1 muramoyltetrapeptide carboxypeptidase [Sporolactobacillus inulinus]
MPVLKKGDAVGLISCSDGLRQEDAIHLQTIRQQLIRLGLTPIEAKTIFRQNGSPFSGSAKARASELMRFYQSDKIKAIFDVSGGDSANQILPHLDFAMIRRAAIPFVGISDLSVINNAVYACTDQPAYHYRIKNLSGAFADQQKDVFQQSFMTDRSFSDRQLHWLRGHSMSGIVIGGNIRCFLKLAGTRYFPDPTDKIVFLEALGGGPARMASLLAQLDQLSVFKQCSGVLLGTFSEMQVKQYTPLIETLVLEISDRYHLPVAKTEQLGHGEDACCLPIGLPLTL